MLNLKGRLISAIGCMFATAALASSIDAPDSALIASIKDALKSKDEAKRAAAVDLLVKLNKESAKNEVTYLISLLTDDNREVREAACEPLALLGSEPEARQAVGPLVRAFVSNDAEDTFRPNRFESALQMYGDLPLVPLLQRIQDHGLAPALSCGSSDSSKETCSSITRQVRLSGR